MMSQGFLLSRLCAINLGITKPRACHPGCWCGRRDLNPYSLQNTPLKRARMPIPPRPHTVKQHQKL